MLYILCVEVLACRIRSTPEIEGFLLPGARGKRFKVSQYADDTTGYLKDFRSLRLFRYTRGELGRSLMFLSQRLCGWARAKIALISPLDCPGLGK